jgi:RHS repeat-associated protein
MDPSIPPADRQVNQYTTVTTNSTPAQQLHDENGNNIFDGVNTHRFNYLNQLTEIIRSDNTRTVYRYDASGRRISKKALNQYGYEVNFPNAPTPQILYFSEGANELEEFKADNTLHKRYIHGIMIDEVLAADIGTNRFFYHDNSLGSVAAITTSVEALQESYKYDVYGEEAIFDSSTTQVAQSIAGNPHRFTFRRRDFEESSALYYFRARYYRPETGRFIQRDPLGSSVHTDDIGNGYVYSASNPIYYVDSFGTQPQPAESEKYERTAKLHRASLNKFLVHGCKDGDIHELLMWFGRVTHLFVNYGKTPIGATTIQGHYHQIKLKCEELSKDMLDRLFSKLRECKERVNLKTRQLLNAQFDKLLALFRWCEKQRNKYNFKKINEEQDKKKLVLGCDVPSVLVDVPTLITEEERRLLPIDIKSFCPEDPIKPRRYFCGYLAVQEAYKQLPKPPPFLFGPRIGIPVPR